MVGYKHYKLSIQTIESIQAFMFYLMQYTISNLNAFILIITIFIHSFITLKCNPTRYNYINMLYTVQPSEA